MSTSYIPATDAGLAAWSANFEGIVDGDYAALGLTMGQAAAVTAADTAYQAAYTAAIDPSTRTPVTIAAKDAARAALLGTVRPVAIQVRNNPAVSDATKVSLGLTVPTVTPTPVPAPTTVPTLAVLQGTPGIHKIESRDDSTPTSKAKPPGSLQLQLWVAYGVAPAPDPTTAEFEGVYTKSPFSVSLPVAQAGKVATYFGRWVTRRGLVGPWSGGASMTVGF